MFSYREIELVEALEAFVDEHVEVRIVHGGDRHATLLGPNGPAQLSSLEGGGRQVRRVARLFLEELRRRGFRVVDDEER